MTDAIAKPGLLRVSACALLLVSIIALFLPWLRLTVTLPVPGMGGMTMEQLLETVAGKPMSEIRAGLRETVEARAEDLRAAGLTLEPAELAGALDLALSGGYSLLSAARLCTTAARAAGGLSRSGETEAALSISPETAGRLRLAAVGLWLFLGLTLLLFLLACYTLLTGGGRGALPYVLALALALGLCVLGAELVNQRLGSLVNALGSTLGFGAGISGLSFFDGLRPLHLHVWAIVAPVSAAAALALLLWDRRGTRGRAAAN